MKKVCYSDDKTINEGNTTVVLGHICFNYGRTSQITDTVQKAIDAFGLAQTCKGIAHLSPKDTFDKKTGIIVASRKSEFKGYCKALKQYYYLLSALLKASDMVKEDIADINEHLEYIDIKLDEYDAKPDSEDK
jgi:hypothetical protein